MANQTEFKVIVTYEDGQAKVKIEELTTAINKNSEASKKAASSTDELGNANKRLKEPLEGTIGALEKENAELLKQIKNQTTSTVEGAKLAKRYQQNSIEIQRMTAEMGLFNKVNQGMISNTGLAGATLTEFGRTISDAPYGIQGMANNMSQLSSLFTTFVSKTEGGVIPALRQLRKEFLGPLGIVIAIQAALAAWEFLANRQKEAADSATEARYENIANRGVLLGLVDVLNDVNTSEEDRLGIIEKLKKEVPSLKDEDFEYGKNLDEVTEKILKYTLAQANRAEAEKLVQDNRELLAKREEVTRIKEIQNDEERLAAFEEFSKRYDESVSRYNEVTKTATGLQGQFTQLVAKTPEELLKSYESLGDGLIEQSDKVYQSIQDLIKSSSSELFSNIKGSGDKTLDLMNKLRNELSLSDKKGFDEKIERNRIQFEDTIAKINASALSQIEKDEAISLATQIRYNKDKAVFDEIQEYLRDQENKTEDLRQKSLDKQSKERQKFYRDNLKEILDTNKQEVAAETAAAIEGVETREEAQKQKRKIEKRGLQDLKDNLKVALDAGIITAEQYAAEIAKIESKMTGLIISGLTGKKEEGFTPREKFEQTIKDVQEAIGAIENVFDSQFDADVSREEAKTEKMNNELRKRLRNESLSAKERENINAQISSNEDKLQQKRDEIAERNFKLQKAANIANALVETYRVGWLAFGSQMQVGDPTSPARAAVAKALTIAAGLANVAMIARQKFVPSALSTPSIGGGGASAPSIQAPDFNIVGQSGINQLSEALQAQSDKPVKAYVVSKDISTAQELDRNKVLSSGL